MTPTGEARSRNAQRVMAVSGGVMVLCAFLSLMTGHRSFAPASSPAASGTAETTPAQPAVVVTLYVSRLAIVRNAPSTTGSQEVARLSRGAIVQGAWVSGTDPTSSWLNITIGAYAGDFISGVNLSATPRPDVVRELDSDAAIRQTVELRELPDPGSAALDTLNAGLTVHISAEVAGGWWEVQRRLGGVGYLPPDAFNAPADPSAIVSGSGTLAAPDPGQIALAQIRNYWAQWSSSSPSAMNDVRQTYGDPVVFFGTSISLNDIMLQKQTFADRWPQRSYVMRDDSLQTACDSMGASCTVTGIVDWNVQSAARGASSQGAANFTFTLNIQDGLAKIVAESSEVISRNR
jgi:hypothetical protein